MRTPTAACKRQVAIPYQDRDKNHWLTTTWHKKGTKRFFVQSGAVEWRLDAPKSGARCISLAMTRADIVVWYGGAEHAVSLKETRRQLTQMRRKATSRGVVLQLKGGFRVPHVYDEEPLLDTRSIELPPLFTGVDRKLVLYSLSSLEFSQERTGKAGARGFDAWVAVDLFVAPDLADREKLTPEETEALLGEQGFLTFPCGGLLS